MARRRWCRWRCVAAWRRGVWRRARETGCGARRCAARWPVLVALRASTSDGAARTGTHLVPSRAPGFVPAPCGLWCPREALRRRGRCAGLIRRTGVWAACRVPSRRCVVVLTRLCCVAGVPRHVRDVVSAPRHYAADRVRRGAIVEVPGTRARVFGVSASRWWAGHKMLGAAGGGCTSDRAGMAWLHSRAWTR